MHDLYDDHIDQDYKITNEIYPVHLPVIAQAKGKIFIFILKIRFGNIVTTFI